jgi:GNAT superfamily N-acetyltransferase
MNNFNFRRATVDDFDFIFKAIIEADKGFSEISSYSRLCGLNQDELSIVFKNIFEEELENSEFGYNSFFILFDDEKPIATAASWIEGLDGLPSWQIKSSALFCHLPKDNFLELKSNTENFNSIIIPRTEHALQFESLYIEPAYRGKGFFLELLNFHINFARTQNHDFDKVELITYNSNTIAESAYRKAGFNIINSTLSDHPDIDKFYPANGMNLWQKKL